MSQLHWIGLGLGMLLYTGFTAWGWRLAPQLSQRPDVSHKLLLFTLGVWLELVFFDLMPATQSTLLGNLGYRLASLFSLILFFTPIIMLSGLDHLLGRQANYRLRLALFCGQNLLEGMLIYSLVRVNPWLGIGYLLLTAPHAGVEAMTIRQIMPALDSYQWGFLVGANGLGLVLGYGLMEGQGSLIGLAVFNQLLSGYLIYICLADLYQEVVIQQGTVRLPWPLFLGMALMGLLNVIV